MKCTHMTAMLQPLGVPCFACADNHYRQYMCHHCYCQPVEGMTPAHMRCCNCGHQKARVWQET